MNNHELLTPENCRELLKKTPEALQHGFVKGYTNLLISQPVNTNPPSTETDALLYVRLDIEPDNTSDIMVLYIKFVPDNTVFEPVRYSHQNGNASKPISHYAPLMDLLKNSQTSARRVEVFLQTNADERNAVVLL